MLWFVGFDDLLIVGVWVGNDNHSPMNGVAGGTLPAMIWKRLMEQADAPAKSNTAELPGAERTLGSKLPHRSPRLSAPLVRPTRSRKGTSFRSTPNLLRCKGPLTLNHFGDDPIFRIYDHQRAVHNGEVIRPQHRHVADGLARNRLDPDAVREHPADRRAEARRQLLVGGVPAQVLHAVFFFIISERQEVTKAISTLLSDLTKYGARPCPRRQPLAFRQRARLILVSSLRFGLLIGVLLLVPYPDELKRTAVTPGFATNCL